MPSAPRVDTPSGGGHDAHPKAMTDEDWRAWTRTHQVCYEVRPLMQMHGAAVVQVGVEFELAARLPRAAEEGREARRRATRAAVIALNALAGRVFPDKGEIARFEVAPFHAVAQLRPETGFQPEVRTSVKIYRRQDSSRSVAAEDRQRLGPFEQRLKELGAEAGSWKQGR
jgi:hypothetical protein